MKTIKSTSQTTTNRVSGIFSVLLVLFCLTLSAGEQFSRKISRSYEVNSNAELTVMNKFGKIQIENWAKNEVSIEVTITVTASNEDRANKALNKISVNISGNASKVTAETLFDEDGFKKGNSEITVNYMIRMPKTMSLDLSNRFGDIVLDESDGQAKISLAYGNILANRFNNANNTLIIKFSKGRVDYINRSKTELKYSELTVDESVEMDAETKFSSLDIKQCGNLILNSGYDDIGFGSVSEMDVKANFSDIRIEELTGRLKAEAGYGDITVKKVSGAFSLIDIKNSFSDVRLTFSEEASFVLDVATKMGDFRYPSDKGTVSFQEITFSSHKYTGTMGQGDGSSSKVIINAKNADVKIDFK